MFYDIKILKKSEKSCGFFLSLCRGDENLLLRWKCFGVIIPLVEWETMMAKVERTKKMEKQGKKKRVYR